MTRAKNKWPALLKPHWGYKYTKKWEQIEINYNFLRRIEHEYGGLHNELGGSHSELGGLWCEFCGKQGLEIAQFEVYTPPKDILATCDHFWPKSQFPQFAHDEDNFVVACDSCNNKKSDKAWTIETIQYPRDESLVPTLEGLLTDPENMICVKCGVGWGPVSNACLNKNCDGFSSWGYQKGKPLSFTVKPNGEWVPNKPPQDENDRSQTD